VRVKAAHVSHTSRTRVAQIQDLLGSNNGGGGGNFSKVKRLFRKCVGTPKRSFLGFSSFSQKEIPDISFRYILDSQRTFTQPVLDRVETQKLSAKTYFIHQTTYAYLPLCMGCWNMQEYLDSDLFWAGDDRFCGGFPTFCVLAPLDQTCQLFNSS